MVWQIHARRFCKHEEKIINLFSTLLHWAYSKINSKYVFDNSFLMFTKPATSKRQWPSAATSTRVSTEVRQYSESLSHSLCKCSSLVRCCLLDSNAAHSVQLTRGSRCLQSNICMSYRISSLTILDYTLLLFSLAPESQLNCLNLAYLKWLRLHRNQRFIAEELLLILLAWCSAKDGITVPGTQTSST